jgi:hypothetical protein
MVHIWLLIFPSELRFSISVVYNSKEVHIFVFLYLQSSKLLLAFASTVILGFGPRRDLLTYFIISRLLRVLKWSPIFEENRGLTTTGLSPTFVKWVCWLSLTQSTHSSTHSNSTLLISDVHSCLLSPGIKQESLGRTNHLLSFNTARTEQKTTRPKILLLLLAYLLPRGHVYRAVA